MDFNLKEQAAYRVGSIISDLVSGADVQVGTVLNTAEIADDAITVAKVGKAALQGGQGLTSSSVLWVVFPTAFATIPFISVSMVGSTSTAAVAASDGIAVGSLSPGSFYAISSASAETFHWIAIGSHV